MMNKEKWILVAIGCPECGQQSDFIGFYESKEMATDEWYKIEARGEEYHHPLIQKVKLPQ